MTAVYNQAKVSPCALRFHLATEGGWDAGGAVGCLSAAAMLQAGAPMSWAILISLVGVAGAAMLLGRYYGTQAAPPGVAALAHEESRSV